MRLVCCANSSGAGTFVFLINIPCSNMCHKPQGLLSLDMYYNSIISGLRNHACSKNYADHACSKKTVHCMNLGIMNISLKSYQFCEF